MTLAALLHDASERYFDYMQNKLTAMGATTDEHHLSMDTIISSLHDHNDDILTDASDTEPDNSQSPSSAHPHMEERSSFHYLPLAIRHQHGSSNVLAICRAAGCLWMNLRRMVFERRSNLFREECSRHSRSFCPNVRLFAQRFHVVFVGFYESSLVKIFRTRPVGKCFQNAPFM